MVVQAWERDRSRDAVPFPHCWERNGTSDLADSAVINKEDCAPTSLAGPAVAHVPDNHCDPISIGLKLRWIMMHV